MHPRRICGRQVEPIAFPFLSNNRYNEYIISWFWTSCLCTSTFFFEKVKNSSSYFILQDGYEQLDRFTGPNLKGIIRVKFINEQVSLISSYMKERKTNISLNITQELVTQKREKSIYNFRVIIFRVLLKLELIKMVFLKNFLKMWLQKHLIHNSTYLRSLFDF